MNRIPYCFAVLSLCFSGCIYGQVDDGDNYVGPSVEEYRAVCEAMYWRDFYGDENYFNNNYIRLDKLSEEQSTQLKKKYVDACVYLYAPVHVCHFEEYEYYKCMYVDHTTAFWKQADEKVEKCYKDFGYESEEFFSCVSSSLQACANVNEALNSCKNSNLEAWNKFFSDEYVNPANEAIKLLKNWKMMYDYDDGDQGGYEEEDDGTEKPWWES